ncbi:UNVERIFIED_CONTAM: hypothetical protein FKN15_053652 [Acipenser sinensis]
MSEMNLGGPLFGEAPDILARVDKDAKVSKKRRMGSISRAFSWLKGKKKKRSSTSSAGSGGGSKKGGHPKSKEQRGDSATQGFLGMSETNLGGPLFGEAPDILARVDKDAKVSKKRRMGSISRAFSWLKGKKKKRSSTSSAGSGGGSKKGGHPKSKEQRGDSATQGTGSAVTSELPGDIAGLAPFSHWVDLRDSFAKKRKETIIGTAKDPSRAYLEHRDNYTSISSMDNEHFRIKAQPGS